MLIAHKISFGLLNNHTLVYVSAFICILSNFGMDSFVKYMLVKT